MMGTYYTKCGREFQKSGAAAVTGYQIAEHLSNNTIADIKCKECPFSIDVKEGYPERIHKRFECRAGSLPPNQNNDWNGSIEDKNTIHIYSLHNDFLESIIEYCKGQSDISASYNQDNADCRRTLSISCSGNKKGIAAKKELIKKFFPDRKRTPIKEGDIMGMENYKKGILSGLERMKNNNIEERAISKSVEFDIVDSKEIQLFDYSLVDADTAEFLRQKEAKITQIRMMSVMAIGKELKEIHDKLANNKSGTFGKWCTSIGMSDQSAMNYIRAFDYIAKNFGNIEEIENIQPSLLFAISKPSAPAELQEAVISGDITTHKQYKELEEKLKAAEYALKQSQDQHKSKNDLHKDNIRILNTQITELKYELADARTSGNNSEVEELQIQLAEAHQQIEELQHEINVPGEIRAVAVIEKEEVPDDILEELAELRSKREAIEVAAEIKMLFQELNSKVISIAQKLSEVDYKDMITIIKCRSCIDPVRENMLLLKKLSLENLKIDLFDFIQE